MESHLKDKNKERMKIGAEKKGKILFKYSIRFLKKILLIVSMPHAICNQNTFK